MLLKRFGNLERAPGRFLRAAAKDQRHPIAGWQPNELFVARLAHLRRPEHDLRELVQSLFLLLVQELRVTDDVDEENMPNLEAKIVVRFRHRLLLLEAIRCGDVFLRRFSNREWTPINANGVGHLQNQLAFIAIYFRFVG